MKEYYEAKSQKLFSRQVYKIEILACLYEKLE